MNKDNYWFYFEPYVHISIKNNNVLLFNTLNRKILEYKNKQKITGLVKTITSPENLLVIEAGQKDLADNEISQFIKIYYIVLSQRILR